MRESVTPQPGQVQSLCGRWGVGGWVQRLLPDLHAPTQAWGQFPGLTMTQSKKGSVVCEIKRSVILQPVESLVEKLKE